MQKEDRGSKVNDKRNDTVVKKNPDTAKNAYKIIRTRKRQEKHNVSIPTKENFKQKTVAHLQKKILYGWMMHCKDSEEYYAQESGSRKRAWPQRSWILLRVACFSFPISGFDLWKYPWSLRPGPLHGSAFLSIICNHHYLYSVAKILKDIKQLLDKQKKF